MSEYHNPVMLTECIEGLDIKPDGIYVDVTFGGGGHSKEILKHLQGDGKLLAFDQDDESRANADLIENRSFTFVQSNFRHLKKFLRLHGVSQVDGILADLGVSSHQINTPDRGFSTRFDGPLDMRMNQSQELNAETVINTYSEQGLHKIFGQYGEVRNARTLAATICRERSIRPIQTIGAFLESIKSLAPRGKDFKYNAQVFQAIRIEVNEELKALEEMLEQSAELLKSKGKLVVMSYHSLEDRLAKNYVTKGNFKGNVEKDFYGNVLRPFDPVNRKLILPSEKEVENNNRARSARLRIAERTTWR